MTRPWFGIAIAGLLVASAPADAMQVRFDSTWREQKFSLFSSNEFGLSGDRLTVRSDGTVSLIWRPLPRADWPTREAAWQWRVRNGVPPTDLTRKGVDDRNLAVYFVFLPQAEAERAEGKDIGDLLDQPNVRVLMYVWGGDRQPGTILPTPYLGERGRTVIRQPARTGTASERVNLAADYRAAFGELAESLVGLAVSADSDDTDSRIDAVVCDLRLLP